MSLSRGHRFHGAIAGVGSTSGVRIVVGRWDESPLGTFADVMLAEPDGTRVLLAPTRRSPSSSRRRTASTGWRSAR